MMVLLRNRERRFLGILLEDCFSFSVGVALSFLVVNLQNSMNKVEISVSPSYHEDQ